MIRYWRCYQTKWSRCCTSLYMVNLSVFPSFLCLRNRRYAAQVIDSMQAPNVARVAAAMFPPHTLPVEAYSFLQRVRQKFRVYFCPRTLLVWRARFLRRMMTLGCSSCEIYAWMQPMMVAASKRVMICSSWLDHDMNS